jgi:PQQ-dependent dehydrogenase (methanol/ethanol family)
MNKIYSALKMSTCLLLASNSFALDTQSLIDPGNEWLSHGRDYSEQRFSPLVEINTENVSKLDLAWSFDFDTARGMEATPIVHNGVIYISTGWSHVHAIDARSGKELWHYDAKVDKAHLVRTCCGPVNRGVALWSAGDSNDSDNFQVFFGALDGRLISLDARTGEQLWAVQTTPTDGNYSITGAPRVVDGLVIIGNGGAELGVRGFISAYDAKTGEQKWRFYTVPGDPNQAQESPELEKALATWKGDYWYQNGGGGGTAWDSIVHDPELDLLYFGTGNGSPWNRDIRSPGGGDNLYLSSIVAVRPSTGEYVWHYQTTPRENWDYTATQQLVLAELELNGEKRKVIMQAPKNGFFYVLDRASGELLSADAYTYITWASHVDMQTGRPVESKYADYQSYGDTLIWPAPVGAHNWQPMSFSPKTGLMYIPVQNLPGFYSALGKADYGVGRWNTGVDLSGSRDPASWVTAEASTDALVYGELVAWDPAKQQRAWAVTHKYASNGGILSTAGDLVFQGTREGLFAAYDSRNGKALWQYQSSSAVLAGPISYKLDGEQYIAVAQGRGGALAMANGRRLKREAVNHNRLLVFKLGDFNRTRKMPNTELSTILSLGHEVIASDQEIEQGAVLYGQNCSVCHGISAKGNGVIPDLRYMNEQTHSEFVAIAFGGVLAHKGMVGFHKTLSVDDIGHIHDYLDSEQQRLPNMTEMSVLQKAEYWLVYWGSKAAKYFPSVANLLR